MDTNQLSEKPSTQIAITKAATLGRLGDEYMNNNLFNNRGTMMEVELAIRGLHDRPVLDQ